MCILCPNEPVVTPMSIEVRSASLDQPEVTTLIKALNAELEQRYPEEESNHLRLDSDEVASGRGVFLGVCMGKAL